MLQTAQVVCNSDQMNRDNSSRLFALVDIVGRYTPHAYL